MKQSVFEIVSNEALTDSVYKMVLSGDTSAITASGQFVNIQLTGKFLRRPISVCDYDGKTLTIVYKVVGHGTEQMSHMGAGEKLDILTGLGNGYDLTVSGDHPVLLGGGVGVPPMYNLAKKLRAGGKAVSVILGFNTKNEIFYENEFKTLGCDVTVTTVTVEGHAHSDSCYAMVLTCGQSDEAHVHGDACYQTNSLCDLMEEPGHTHQRDCYDPQLICEIEETEGHTHTAIFSKP